MKKQTYGHRTPDIGPRDFASGWILGVRHLSSKSAKGSFWHRHDETSVICCLRGEYVYEFHGIPPVTLSAGSFLVIPAQVEHRHFMAIDPVGERLEILLAPKPPKPLRHSVFAQESCRTLHAALLKRALSPVKCGKTLLADCRDLHYLAERTAGSLSPEELGLARLLCQLALYRMTHREKPVPQRTAVQFKEIVEWLENHIGERIDINRLVAHIGYSRTQVFTLFREQTGLTPADFLTRLRIKRACSLLKSTDMPACGVASLCGFSSASTFNAVFRRQTGSTPNAWRTDVKGQEAAGTA